MSASRRRKIPGPPPLKSSPAADEELPTLEPIVDDEELPTLEALDEDEVRDDSPVTVRFAAGGELGFDACLEAVVPEMEKAAVADAVVPPLRRAVAQHADALRWRSVLVRFAGDAVIGSALKGIVAEVLEPAKPTKVVVRRGFGDETVHEASLPKVDMDVQVDGDTLQIGVFTGKLDAEDLPTALAPELVRLAERLRDAQITFTFTGRAKPDAPVAAWLAQQLDAAGAKRAAIADLVLFDRELEARVRVGGDPTRTTVDVFPADVAAVTCAALELVLPRASEQLADRHVHLRFNGRRAQPIELAKFLECCASALPARIELEQEDGGPDVLWPRLLHAAARDDQAVVRVEPGDRDRAALISAFRREAPGLTTTIASKHVSVDWPAGFEIDDEVESICLVEALGSLHPTRISCTFGGELQEPFVPPPVTVHTHGQDGLRVRIDTDASKPAETVRAIERRLQRHAAEIAGKTVRVELTGGGTVSRTMLRTLRTIIEGAGVARLEVDDHGKVDVLIPPLLTVESVAADRIQIDAAPGGRDAGQIATALERELDAHDLSMDATFQVGDAECTSEIVDALVQRGARRVLRGGAHPVQLHPKLFAPTERSGSALTLRASPDGDDATLSAQVDAELPALMDAAGDLAGVAVRLVWPGVSEPSPAPVARAIAALVARHPARVLLDRGARRALQVFPELVVEYVKILGKKDASEPPIVLLGIDVGDDDEHRDQVILKLESLRDQWTGRRVLVTLRDEGHDVPIAGRDALVDVARKMLDDAAAATLVFRGTDPKRRPYFEVVHSNLAELEVGARIADPRGRS